MALAFTGDVFCIALQQGEMSAPALAANKTIFWDILYSLVLPTIKSKAVFTSFSWVGEKIGGKLSPAGN